MFREMVEAVKTPLPVVVTIQQKGHRIQWNTMPDDLTDEELRYVLASALLDLDNKMNADKMAAMLAVASDPPDGSTSQVPPSFADYPDEAASNAPASPDVTPALPDLQYEPVDDASAVMEAVIDLQNVAVLHQLHRGKGRDKAATTSGHTRKKKA